MKATSGFIGGSHSRIATRSNQSNRRSLRRNWNQFLDAFVTLLAGNTEPKIQQISEDNWRVYDPQSNRTLSFASEQEVRVWLDERYNF
jgi:hypothetical protein